MRRLSTSCLLIPVLALTVAAQEREKPPAGGTPKPFTVPASSTASLKNGVKVTMVPYGAIPKATILVSVRTGNLNESAEQDALADIVGTLLKQGTGSKSAEQIAEAAARMGGGINISVTGDRTIVSGDVLAEFAPDLVALLADVVQHPTFPEAELDRVKKNFQRTFAIQRAQPQVIADEAFRKIIYGDHPYGRPLPSDERIRTYTVADVKKFYGDNYGAARTHIYVAGKFEKSLLKTIEQSFQDWTRGPDPLIMVPKTKPAKVVQVIDRPNAPQSTIRLGLPILSPDHPDYIPMQVTNNILGGSFASRITTNIREQKGYTYSPFSNVATHYHEGYWVENADVTTKVTGAAIQEIFNEIGRIRKDPPTKQELDGIKSYMSGIFVLQNSSRQGILGQIAFKDLQGLPDSYLTNYIPNVMKVTPQDVQRLSETFLSPNKMTLVVVGDKSQIADQIKPFEQ